ncbi:PX domain-containing protein kinase-like protein isoform X2 [Adelges cooleyi]|uniref:PX domain-containing protein kinase-like protein isoform X2 n=1 Tax=Adelges cooleyi TaxID=133065 RepID=UPI0021803C02|nr:PX domain-containing protein kinase-like protein isoform X2 [Adelges cooleyi]
MSRNQQHLSEYAVRTIYIPHLIRVLKNIQHLPLGRQYQSWVLIHNKYFIASSNFSPEKKRLAPTNKKTLRLTNCLDIMVDNIMLANSLLVRSFLDPETYAGYCKESHLQKVGMVLRGNREFELSKELPSIGWRLRRKSFLSKWKKDPKQEFLLSWTENGPDLILRQQDLNSVLKSISSIIHPLIDVPVILPSPEAYTLSIHNIQVGSLRDLLYQTTPLQPFLKKYWDVSTHIYLPDQTMRSLIKQILYGLKFLHDNHIPYGHLHSGNIIVCDIENIKLTGIENSSLGLSSYYRSFLVQLGKKRIQSLNDADIYGFGHILYELTENEPLTRPSCEFFSQKTPINLTKQMKTILAPSSSKPMPDVNDVIKNFKHARIIDDQKDASFFQCKIPSVIQQQYKRVANKCISRLFEDQKKFSLEKRNKNMKDKINKMFDDEICPKNFKFCSIQNVNMNENTNRSHSSSSNSTLTSLGSDTQTNNVANTTLTASYPPPPPPPPPSNTVTNSPEPLPQTSYQRTALLSSISSFNPNKLKKVAK